MKKKNLTSLSKFIDQEVGKKGTKNRDKFEINYETFKSRVLISNREKKINEN
jgi:hypothetical protein